MDVGVRIQQYEVIEHIGRGGMADVWSARDSSLGRMVAIKTISPDLSTDQDPIQMFEQEARTIANLEHPHILPIYGFGQYEGKLYIIMRYVTGGSLEDLLKDKAVTYKQTVRVGRSLAEALQHAHSENVVHLDLKPPNVLLDSRRVPYLADFGLATALGADGRAKNPGAGTLLYMAPEQMTAEEIDHRADIYSFALVLFHMLTGQLPFNGRQPLSLRQLQFQDRLPHLADINADLPPDLTDVLRQGTALQPQDRYADVMQLMEDVAQVMGIAGSPTKAQSSGAGTTAFTDLISGFDPEAVEQSEAEDIYQRAHQAWAGGYGRFLLSITHFMVMSDFYAQADIHNLEIDRDGLQLLLRGALEHDYNIDYWWQEQPDNDSRRWVCLHAIRSENPQARIRAYQRLHNLPDASPPLIASQMAQALALENNEAAILAALTVFSERTRFIPDGNQIARKGRGGGRTTVIDTIMRDQLQIISGTDWRPFAYSEEIDERVADIALDGRSNEVRTLAARTIGRMRSVAAMEYLMEKFHTKPTTPPPSTRSSQRNRGEAIFEQLTNRSYNQYFGTIKVLAYVLDEVPALPADVPFNLRLAAWLRNTFRRLTENPMGIVWAFTAALMLGWVAMGQHVYRIFRAQAIFNQQRILNTFAIGLLFGFFVGVLNVIAKTMPERLRGFWPNWTRLLWSGLSAYYLSQLIWWAYVWALLNLDSPPKEILVITGVGTAIGFVLPAMIKMLGWLAFVITVVTTFTVQYIGFYNFWSAYYGTGDPYTVRLFGLDVYTLRSTESWIFAYDQQVHVWTIMLPMIVLFALGVHLPALLTDLRDIFRRGRPLTVEELQQITPDAHEMVREPKRIVPVTQRRQAQEISMIETQNTVLGTDEFKALAPLDAKTEELELDRLGGRGDTPTDDIDADTDWGAIMSPLSQHTEEFEVNRTGGRGDAPTDEHAADIDADTDWDAIMSPLSQHTEEFEVNRTGGRGDTPDEYAETVLGVGDYGNLSGPSAPDPDDTTDNDIPDEYANTVLGVQNPVSEPAHADTADDTTDSTPSGKPDSVETTDIETLGWGKLDDSPSATEFKREASDEATSWDNITQQLDRPDNHDEESDNAS